MKEGSAIRILYVISGFLPAESGGTQLHLFYLAREMKRRGHEIHIFTREADPARGEYEIRRDEYRGLGITRLNYNFKDCTEFHHIYINRRIEECFEDALISFAPDLAHIHHLTCLTTTIIDALRKHSIPQVMTLHDYWMICPRGQRIMKDLTLCREIDRSRCFSCLCEMWDHFFKEERELKGIRKYIPGFALRPLKAYDQHMKRALCTPEILLTPSEFHRRKFIEYGIPPERIRAVPHGWNKETYGRMERVPSSITRFAFIGSVIPSKGVHVLVEAFKLLDEERARLDIYGEPLVFHGDSSYADRLKDLIGRNRDIHLHGRYENEDLTRILGNADILVIPSVWYESFCLTIREGFLGGIPVIASRLGAMEEAVRDGETGLLFNPGDAHDLARKMELLMRDPELRAKLSNKQNEVKGIEENGEEILRIYESLARR